MASWDLRRLQIHLQKNPPHPIYFVVGEEVFLVDEAVSVIKQVGLEGGAADFNFDQFFAGEDDAIKIRDTVEMLPMMSPRRVVLVRSAQLLKDKDWDDLAAVIDSPVESTTLVFVADKVDKRKKFYKKVSEQGVIIELARPYENQLPSWIEYIGAKYGLSLHTEAVSLLRQFVGANLGEIRNEILKLRDYIGTRTSITPEDVLQVVSRSRAESMFDLTNAIGRKDRATALHSLANLLGQGQSEVGAVALIARHLRILGVVREGARAGVPPTKVCLQAGIPNFFLKDYQTQARQWSDDKLERTMLALKETDKALKSSPVSSHIWLENFIIRTTD